MGKVGNLALLGLTLEKVGHSWQHHDRCMPTRNYPNPPIQEAVFDVRFKFPTVPTMGGLESFWKTIDVNFPKKESVFNFQTLVEFNPAVENPSINNQREQVGLRLSSPDGSRIFVIKTDGIVFSCVHGYDGCTAFLAEADVLLKKYINQFKPDYAERIALRYINAIHIPETTFELGDYFLTAPIVGATINQDTLAFFSRLMIKDKTSNTVAIIHQTTVDPKPQKIGETVVILDIDTFQQGVRINLDSEEFTKSLDQIKEFRTQVFEGSITEKARSLFT